MSKTVKSILLIIALTTLIFPFWFPVVLVSIISTIDSINVKVLPSSVLFDERNFLLGLWLGSLIMTIVMLMQSWRGKSIFYLLGGVLVLLMATGISFSMIPHSELENRRRFVLHDLNAYQWQDYRFNVINKQASINEAIFSQPQKAMEYLKALDKEREKLPGLTYLTEDVSAAMAAKAHYLASLKGTPAQDEAIKTLSFYSDWLLNQPEIVITQVLSALAIHSDSQLEQAGINALLSAPLMVEAWQTLALTYIVKNQPDADIEKAMAALMVAELLSGDKQGYHDTSLQKLVEKEISELPKTQRQIYQILQARAIEDSYLRHRNTPPQEITALAEQRLPVSYAVSNNSTVYLDMQSAMGKEYPGIVTVDSPNEIKNLTEISYPSIRKYISRADVILSVDVDPQGRISGLWVQQGSGLDIFDNKALREALSWRFMPTKEGYRQRVVVRFESARLGWPQYTVEQRPTIIKLARAYARQDTTRISLAESEFERMQKRIPEKEDTETLSRSSYDPYSTLYSRQVKQQQSQRAELQTILKEMQTLPSGKNNHEDWDNSLRFLNEKLATHQDNEDIVRMVARFELQYYNVGTNNLTDSPEIYPQDKEYWQELLLKSRSHFEQAIGLNPNREDVWLGWGITWLDEDPEIAAGAFAKATQQKAQESIGSVLQMLEMRMAMNTLEGARLERYQTLRARMDMRYLPENMEINIENDYLSDNLTQIQLAQRPILKTDVSSKVVRKPLNTTSIEKSNRLFSIDFSSANIKGSAQVLPKVMVAENAPKMGEMILQLDIDTQGVPAVVMIKSGSGDTDIDNAVIDAAYQWRFNGTQKGNIVLISVQFSQ